MLPPVEYETTLHTTQDTEEGTCPQLNLAAQLRNLSMICGQGHSDPWLEGHAPKSSVTLKPMEIAKELRAGRGADSIAAMRSSQSSQAAWRAAAGFHSHAGRLWRISDHYPLWPEFSIWPGGGGRRLLAEMPRRRTCHWYSRICLTHASDERELLPPSAAPLGGLAGTSKSGFDSSPGNSSLCLPALSYRECAHLPDELWRTRIPETDAGTMGFIASADVVLPMVTAECLLPLRTASGRHG